MKLSQLKENEEGYITKIKGRGAFRKRITEMGFVKGERVVVVKSAPLRDPVEYFIMGYNVSLRRSEASLIEIITKEEISNLKEEKYNGILSEDELKKTAKLRGKEIQVALVGNPNSGKTTLFNHASKSKEHVGNYSGVTIDSKLAQFKYGDYKINITDLPGTYSLSAYSPEELYVRKFILGELPDIVINVVDASNLQRNLLLTTQLIDMDIKVVIALNMYDELKKSGDQFDYEGLGKMIGIPITPTVGSKGYGVRELFKKVIEVYEDRDPNVRHVHINHGQEVEKSVKRLQDCIWENKRLTDLVSSRFYALKLLEKDSAAQFTLSKWKNWNEIEQIANEEILRLEKLMLDDSETILTDAKYGFIAGALKETYKGNRKERVRFSDHIDRFLTNKYLGLPIFIFFMWFMFQVTFKLGNYPMAWIEHAISWLGSQLDLLMNPGPLKDLLINGVIDGVGGVIVFLPNILILFFFISVMEDTGYMARAAFIMDKIMHKIGLHGRSFIPLLMGFGCNVPAIMSTRTIENRNNRMVTILINPFMSCSARLPVYVLIISAFFPKHPGTVLFSIYIIGILLAALMAILFKKTLFKSDEVPFVMELPPYRIPTLKSTLRHMWHKGEQYLKKMGGIILVASIIIWALGYFPRDVEYSKDFEGIINNLEQGEINKEQSLTQAQLDMNSSIAKEIRNLEMEMKLEHQANSYIGRIGRAIEPVMRPLGFDWRMSVSILSGVAAKEIVVSTMGVLYQTNDQDKQMNEKLAQRLYDARYTYGPLKGKRVFNPLTAYSFLLFILIYFPCLATVVAIKNEAGHWKWALFAVVYSTGLAWFVSFVVYQTGTLIANLL